MTQTNFQNSMPPGLEGNRSDSAKPKGSPSDFETAFAEYFSNGFPPEMAELREQVIRIAPQDITVLLTGETGTGKTQLARLIHSLSPRREEPFLVVDCGAISPTLIESEMFGHVRGAFTGADRDRPGKFAAVGRGTLLLDEVNSLPLTLQSKLLRAVEDRVFEPVGSNRELPLQARIIAVSNAPLDQEIEAGRFRSDLFFRLNIVGFYLPALRSRRSAVAPLCQKFLREFVARNRPDVHGITPEAIQTLQEFDWPGNVRELRNVIERAVALCRGPLIQFVDLPETIRFANGRDRPPIPIATQESVVNHSAMTLAESKEIAEVIRIKEALVKHNNNRLRAADELGISRMGLYKKLYKYGLAERVGASLQEKSA